MIFIGMTFSVTVYASDNSEEEGVIVKEYSYVDEEENIVLVQEKAYNPLSNGENSKLLAAAPNWNAKTELGKAFKFPVPQAQFHSTGTSTSCILILEKTQQVGKG
ncbi:hypothetical protein ACH6EH_19535 [Paenibacillus sp. JSM ZJ436]|uniref:hypothetical protein n=1 Tax=Paenibacillus sp. JSM ZJ436 TaxID=3376190 RepID=UPI0037AC4C01